MRNDIATLQNEISDLKGKLEIANQQLKQVKKSDFSFEKKFFKVCFFLSLWVCLGYVLMGVLRMNRLVVLFNVLYIFFTICLGVFGFIKAVEPDK
jgi:hypothetical protein